MNKHLFEIFKIFTLLQNLPEVKNISGAVFNDLLFGIKPNNRKYYDVNGNLRTIRKGYFGTNFIKSHFVNSSGYDLNTDNNSKEVIKYIINIQHNLYKEHLVPLYIELYIIVKERFDMGTPVYQSELGKLLNIPVTLYPNNSNKDFMIQELIGYAAQSGLIIVDKNRKLYILPGDINKIPKNHYSYELFKNKKSKPERFIQLLLKVQGEQHYKYIKFFHRKYENFLKRLKFDKKKKNHAIKAGYHYLAITNDEIKENKANNKLINFIESLRV